MPSKFSNEQDGTFGKGLPGSVGVGRTGDRIIACVDRGSEALVCIGQSFEKAAKGLEIIEAIIISSSVFIETEETKESIGIIPASSV